MKKSVLFMTAALCFGAAGAQTPVATTVAQAPALTDVPAGHWAKDAVERLVSEGIILGYPDGTFRGTQTLTRYEASMIINRLLDRMGNGEVVVGDIDDATMVSLRNAINELSAQGAAFEVRLADLEANAVSQEDFNRLEGRVDALATTGTDNTDVADQLATVNEMATLLNQDVLHLQDRVATVEGDLATFDARLGLVEDQVTDNTAVIGEQGLRIADLENGRVSLTLGLGAGYGNLSLSEGDTPFDVDRVTNSTFAAKEFSDTDNEGKTNKVDVNKNISSQDELLGLTLGVKATDIDAGSGIVIEEAGVNFGFAPATLNRSEKLTNTKGKTDDVYAVTLDSASVTGRVGDDVRFRALGAPGKLKLRPDAFNNVSDLDDIPGYNDYLVPNGGRNGITVGVTLSDVPTKPTLYLAGGVGNKPNLDGPFFAIRSESELGNNGLAAISFVQNNADSLNEAQVKGINGFNSPAERARYIKELGLNMGRTAASAEVIYNVGGEEDATRFGVEALYVASFQSDIFFADQYLGGELKDYLGSREQAALLKAKADTEVAGGAVKADLVARAVSPGFANGIAGMDISDTDSDATPRYTNEIGVGGRINADFNNVNVGAYGDTFVPYYAEEARANYGRYFNYNKDGAIDFKAPTYKVSEPDFFARRTTFGVQAGAGLAGFQVTPFYRRTSIGDKVVRYNDDHADFFRKERYNVDKDGVFTRRFSVDKGYGSVARGNVMKPGDTSKLYMNTSSAGVALTHDGSSDLALVPNLNLTLADAYFYDEGANSFVALAEYDAKIAKDVTLTPFIGYSLLSQDENSAYTEAGAEKFSILKYGVGAETGALDIMFKPKFKASVINAQYNADLFNGGNYTGSELAANATVEFDEVLSPKTAFKVGYGFHQGNNLRAGQASSEPQAFGFGGTAYAPGSLIYNKDEGFGEVDSRTQGVFAQLAWNEALRVNYGLFFHDRDLNSDSDPVNVAQGFKINYGLKF